MEIKEILYKQELYIAKLLEMASRPVKINELLYFVNNNLSLIEEESFINNTSEFYTSDDIVLAIKTLKCEIDSLKLDKMKKFPSRGNSKREKLLECLSSFSYIKNNNLLDRIALFGSSDINKIPNTENWLKINFDFVNKQIKEMLFAQQAEINKMFLSYTTELDNVKNKLNSLVANYVGKKVNVDSVISNNVNNTLPPTNQNAPGILWADFVSSPTLDEAFTLVKRHNKRLRLNVSLEVNNNGETTSNNNNGETTSNNNNENTANIKTAKKPTKVIGKKVIEDCKLRADKNLIKKSVFSMNNIKISLDKNFDKDDQKSTMFRVRIDSSDVGKMKDPGIMLKNIIVREWRFNQTKPDANTLNGK
ncbi:hypothetical protein HELRODRAFT_174322 [Helobdella robusta]|uniref:Uncharacterized protein n=1 Tax=Helobdella robusta TaxID=6412 RepID=T1F801_HELRO|nr:hypothetical protein HELRODRAFT_174322 [Helobdella robusta]ESO02880.1 hypothetical protein HELRODRAFT_174322 [Helobdella robusta]